MSNILKILPLYELRQMWADAWGRKPHARIGRSMLEKSLEYKVNERSNKILTADQDARLSELIRKYKRNSSSFETDTTLKPGTQLVRLHGGEKHTVLVKADGFEYAGKKYTSLSKIANDITGKIWNGWIFFGLKKVDIK